MCRVQRVDMGSYWLGLVERTFHMDRSVDGLVEVAECRISDFGLMQITRRGNLARRLVDAIRTGCVWVLGVD